MQSPVNDVAIVTVSLHDDSAICRYSSQCAGILSMALGEGPGVCATTCRESWSGVRVVERAGVEPVLMGGKPIRMTDNASRPGRTVVRRTL